MAHVTRTTAGFLAACGMALAFHVAPAAADNSEATITIDFTDDCTGFTATSTKDISNVVIDGTKVDNVNSPTFTDEQGGDPIETVSVKSGQTTATENCAPTAPPDDEQNGDEAPPPDNDNGPPGNGNGEEAPDDGNGLAPEPEPDEPTNGAADDAEQAAAAPAAQPIQAPEPEPSVSAARITPKRVTPSQPQALPTAPGTLAETGIGLMPVLLASAGGLLGSGGLALVTGAILRRRR